MTPDTNLDNTARHPRTRRALLAVAAVVPMIAMFGGEHAAAAAAAAPSVTSTDLGSIGYGQVLVDDANRHVLVSGPTGNVVKVLNYSGKVVKNLSGLPGASAMVIHQGTLYIALTTNGTIVKTSLATLAKPVVVARGLLQPTALAWAGGRIWVSASGYFQGELASVNPTSGKVTFQGTYSPLLLATSPALPNTLFIAERGGTPGSVTELNVAGATAKVIVHNGFTDQENMSELAVSPDGTRVIPASGATTVGYVVEELSAKTLKPDGVIYPGAPYPVSVAVSPGRGGIVATGLSTSFFAPAISVEHLGYPKPYFTASLDNIVGLAVTCSANRLFAVANDGFKTTITGYVLP